MYSDQSHATRMIDLSILVTLFRLLLKDRNQLALENIALRQQLAVYKRTVTRPKIEDTSGAQLERAGNV